MVTVDPPIPLPASGVIAAGNSLFQSRQLTLTLLHGQQYYITVRAKSCDDSVEGVVSEAVSIKIQGWCFLYFQFTLLILLLVPPTVLRCVAYPVYDYFSNNLKRIEIEWDPIQVRCISFVRSLNVEHFFINIQDTGEFITAGIPASIEKYIISTVPFDFTLPENNITLGVTDNGICTNTTCKYDFQSTTATLRSNYTLFIIAKNFLHDGYGGSQNCSRVPIS